MPQIPKFTSQARPTAEVGSVKSNLQVPLSQTLAGALQPVTDYVVEKQIQENEIQNKTQALKLENEYNIAMKNITQEIITNPDYGDNQETAQTYYKEQAKLNREKYGSQADNSFIKTMFVNNSLLLDQKFSNKLSKDVSKNVLMNQELQVNIKRNEIISNALLADNSEFNREIVEIDLENLYYTNYFKKIPTALYNELINNIPNEVYGFEITKGLSSNPNETFTKLLDNESYPGLDFKLRTKFIDKGKLILTNPLKLKLNNAIFGLQFQGRSEEVDLPFAKSVLTTEDFNQFKTRYSIAKDNAADVRAINTLPSGEINDYISNKKYTDNDYAGVADLITQQELLTGLQKAANNRNKFMLSDPAGFINETNPEIKELFNNYLNSGENFEAQKQNRQIYNSAVVAEQLKMSGKTAVLKVTTKQEIKNIQAAFSDKNTKAEKKIGLIQQLKTLHGPENINMVAKHLQAEGASEEMLMAISTNSTSLSADLFSSSSVKDLIELTKINEAEASTIQSLIGDKTEDYQLVVSSQGETKDSVAEHNLQVNKGIYKAVLLRIARGETIEDAVESASQDFLDDYKINDEKTMFTPVDVMGVTVPLQASDIKRQGIIDMIKFTDVLDRFMGEDGYAHLAAMTNGENLTEEQIREKILFTARNYPRWINNGDVTGAVLQYELSGANRDIVNSKGQRIEFYFTDQPNQNPDIKSTEFTFPYLPNEILPVADDVDTVGAIEYDTNLDETFPNQNQTLKKVSEVLSDGVSSVFNMGEVSASEFVNFQNVDIDFIAGREGFELIGTVPDAENSKSGVTIASGFDLGARNVNDLEGLPTDIITKLEPFLGLKGNEAVARAKELNITEEEAKIINTFAHKQSLSRLKKKWEKDSGKSFSLLSKEQATVLASVAFQYGTSFEKTDGTRMNFYTQALAGNWGKEKGVRGVYEELLDFKDNYPSRREEEAKYLKKFLDK